MQTSTTKSQVKPRVVSTLADLVEAIGDICAESIVVDTTLTDVPSLRLPSGKSLEGRGNDIRLVFAAGSNGVTLTKDNRIANIMLETEPQKCAIGNDTTVQFLGTMSLRNVKTIGRVRIVASDSVREGHVDIVGLDIVSADSRAETERPRGFGVHVVQGAFTLWNMQPDPDVRITATLLHLSAGRENAPVYGRGIFVSGAGDGGGSVHVTVLETDAVYSNGGIAPGTPDQISGGVFTVHDCYAEIVRTNGPVTTYGPNDMVLDNWGIVDAWIAREPITSHGPSGIGFVNFGTLHELRVDSTIETFGLGARGFNVYDGTVDSSDFKRIVTHGDGAVGIQISKPIGKLVVRDGVETFGGIGDSLVKGVVTQLPAIALSIKPGGDAKSIDISGGLTTHGNGIAPIELHGTVANLRIAGATAYAAASPK